MSTKCKLHSKCVHACSISSQLVLSTRAPPRTKSFPRLFLLVAHLSWMQGWIWGRGAARCFTSSQPLMCQSQQEANPAHPWRHVDAWARLCNVCASHRVHLPVVWVLFYGCLEQSYAVCFIWDHGPWFPRVLRNIQPHPLIAQAGFISVQWRMFPAFTQQSLDIMLYHVKTALKGIFKWFIQQLEKHSETSN